jgi:Uncharacterized protein encoded in toxicity protection region of plasmid R478, contains von Willebrand factor (vWF) domain
MRRLPVYLVLDTSASMKGEPIEAVKRGIETMVGCLRRNPQAIENVYLSVITFDRVARVEVPLTDLASFQLPELNPSGQTALGAALQLTAEKINTEVIRTTPDRKGDWKPIVFIMTDGTPMDDWRKGRDLFRSVKTAFTVACAVGAHADTSVLKQITSQVISLDKTDGDSMSRFFLWLSSSLGTASEKVESGEDLIGLDELPPPPPDVNIIT